MKKIAYVITCVAFDMFNLIMCIFFVTELDMLVLSMYFLFTPFLLIMCFCFSMFVSEYFYLARPIYCRYPPLLYAGKICVMLFWYAVAVIEISIDTQSYNVKLSVLIPIATASIDTAMSVVLIISNNRIDEHAVADHP